MRIPLKLAELGVLRLLIGGCSPQSLGAFTVERQAYEGNALDHTRSEAGG